MSRPVFANDLPYVNGREDPLRAIADTLAFSSRDHGASRDSAWLYGIVHGWDPDPDDDPGDGSAMDELASRFGWTPEQVARLRRLHVAYAVLMAGAS